jgi:3-oxoacyl-[acyl-carrier protein] reductase
MAGLQGQVALVTGAGRGIGKAVALALGAAGAHVVASARTETEIKAVAAQIDEAGGQATALRVDLAQESSVLSLFKRIQERFQHLDVLVNNAGLGLYGPLRDFRTEDLDKMLAVNLRGAFLCCREALRLMEAHKRGYIINVSSVVGFKAYANQAAYTATKHGIMGLTKALALEAQPLGIRVSVVLPGGVDTDLVRAARPDLNRDELLQPEDIAQTVLYLLSLSDRAAVDQIYIRRRNSQPF